MKNKRTKPYSRKPLSPRVQCEGYRRYGGAFCLGPVTWERCKLDATRILEVKQGGKGLSKFPVCEECLQECLRTEGIEVVSITPRIGEK